jgi:L-threonylcarbamoyladenylate synthase
MSFRVSPVKPTRAALRRAARVLRRGQLVSFPTETVYGLGADATSDRAVGAIYNAKRRPAFNPLIVHVVDLRMARRLAHFNGEALRLARRFWPGPLTLVLKRRAGARVSPRLGRGLGTIALRLPDDPVAQSLIRETGRPLAAPSANRSGRVSPTRAGHVRMSLGGRVAMVLDGGECPVGVESTIVDVSTTPPRLLRPGGVPVESLRAVVKRLSAGPPKTGRIMAPGMLPSHYAPRRRVRLNAAAPRTGEAYLAFGRTPSAARNGTTLNLSVGRDLGEAASNLFAMLQALDRPEFTAIAVAPIPARGIGRAINDRLRRAAAPRR